MRRRLLLPLLVPDDAPGRVVIRTPAAIIRDWWSWLAYRDGVLIGVVALSGSGTLLLGLRLLEG